MAAPGISSDYYLRLEQGRDHNPSIQVLVAIARVLQLNQAATDYLLGLVAPQPRQRRRRPRRESVPSGIRQLLDVVGLPAFVEGRYFDVLSFEGAPVCLDHPQAGELMLRREKLSISGTEGQLLVVYHAQSGTSNAEKLALLGSLASSAATVAPQLATDYEPPEVRTARFLAARREGHPPEE